MLWNVRAEAFVDGRREHSQCPHGGQGDGTIDHHTAVHELAKAAALAADGGSCMVIMGHLGLGCIAGGGVGAMSAMVGPALMPMHCRGIAFRRMLNAGRRVRSAIRHGQGRSAL